MNQSSRTAILSWQSFSIGGSASAHFENGTGATLNRVNGNVPSTIDGSLTATGSVFLVNPAGVAVGTDGHVATGGSFVGTTQDVTDSDFLDGGAMTFEGESRASVVNAGTITSAQGDVALIARRVENSGTIEAPNGTAALAAGYKVLMRDEAGARGKFSVEIGGSDTEAVNTGTIKAAQAEMRANGGNVYALAGNTDSVVKATGVKKSGGRIFLTGGSGGSVKTTQRMVARRTVSRLPQNAPIPMPRPRDGGDITIAAGDVKLGGTLDASGTNGGSGGTVMALADGAMDVTGTVLASGSAGAGGGFIETSGGVLSIAGATVDAGSGKWLLDPYDLTVDASAAASINTSLGGGTSVTLQTSDSGTSGPGIADASGNGDIVIDAALSWSNSAAQAATLTLDAWHSIAVNAPISVNGNGGGVALHTNDGGAGGAYAVNAPINLNAGSTFTTQDGAAGPVNYTVVTALGAEGSTTGGDLQGIGAGLNGNYVLGADIDASATAGWNGGDGFAPIGALTSQFTGTLDGLGHTISNLTINRPSSSSVGLFGDLSGTLRNVGLEGSSVTGDNYVGGLVGYNYGGMIGHAYAAGAVRGSSAVAGLAGRNDGTISDAYATGSVIGSSNVGGLVGVNTDTIANAYATGKVIGSSNVGGLVGNNVGGTITNSYWDTETAGTGIGGSNNDQTATGLTTAELSSALPAGFDASIWGNADDQTTPYLLGLSGPVFVGDNSDDLFEVIQTLGELQAVNDGLNRNYVLVDDIDASETVRWNSGSGFVPLGSFSNSFTGAFDGLGHVVSGLTVDRAGTDNVGMFGNLNNAKVTDLTLNGGSITGGSYVGGLVGRVDGDTTISKVRSSAGVTAGSNVGGLVGLQTGGTISTSRTDSIVAATGNALGGLVGQATGGEIVESFTAGSVIGTDISQNVGGLVGYQQDTDITASGSEAIVKGGMGVGGLVGTQTGGTTTVSHAEGMVGSGDAASVGGLVGTLQDGTISLSYANAAVEGAGNLGGLVGEQSGGTIRQSYAEGDVTGADASSQNIGGLVGYLHFDSSSSSEPFIRQSYATGDVRGGISVGGLVGGQYGGTIDQTYATGALTGLNDSYWPGGLIGYEDSGTVSASFWDANTTGQDWSDGSDGATGLATAEFQDTAGFMSLAGSAGWDFQSVWAPPGSGHYPELYALSRVARVDLAGTGPITYGDSSATASVAGVYGGPDAYAFAPAGDTLATPTLDQPADGLDAGTHVVTGADSGTSGKGDSYRFVYTNNILTVKPRALTITPDSVSRFYGEANPKTGSASGDNLVNGDTITSVALSSPADASSDVGAYDLSASNATGEGLSNYAITYATRAGGLTVGKWALTITPDAVSRLYGNDNPGLGTATGDNLRNGDKINSVDLSSSATASSSVGAYDLSASNAKGEGLKNYVITYVVRKNGLTVQPRPITITPDSVSRIYGDANPATGAASGDNLVNDDTITSVALSSPADASSDVGSYDLSASNAEGTGLSNYVVSYAANLGGLRVTPRPITITPDSVSRIYGDANPTTGAASGDNLVNDDTITSVALSSPAEASSNVGGYDLSASNAEGTGLSNYVVSYAANLGGLRVTPRPITVTADDASKLLTAPVPPLTAHVTGGSLAPFDDTLADAFSGYAVTTSASQSSPLGSYRIDVNGTNANYDATFVPGSLSIVAETAPPSASAIEVHPPAGQMTAMDKFNALKQKGIFGGLGSGGTDNLNDEMDRASAAAIIARLAGLDAGASVNPTFADVGNDLPWDSFVEAAKKAGIIPGDGQPGHFDSSENVSLEDFAKVISQALGLGLAGSDIPEENIGAWAKTYVSSALQLGILKPGDTSGGKQIGSACSQSAACADLPFPTNLKDTAGRQGLVTVTYTSAE